MGQCFGVGDTDIHKPLQIQMQLKRLKQQILLKIQKVAQTAMSQQKILIAQFKKQKPYRLLSAQRTLAEQITIKRNKIVIYQINLAQIQKIIDYKHHLHYKDRARESVYPSFRIILYSQQFLKDPSISLFCRQIRKRYPDITQACDEQVDCQIMKYHKKTQIPAQFMVNDYLLSLINQEQLNFQQINSIGHKIRYDGK